MNPKFNCGSIDCLGRGHHMVRPGLRCWVSAYFPTARQWIVLKMFAEFLREIIFKGNSRFFHFAGRCICGHGSGKLL